MIEARFGLSRRAFPASPDHTSYYPATGHERALARLLAGLIDGDGMLVLTAPPGLGKTLLAGCLLDRAGEAREIESVFLVSVPSDRVGLLQSILYDLSLPYQGRTEQEMRLALIDHLLLRYAGGSRLLLVIDEAHHLTADQLEDLRMLGNLEGHAGKAVQIVLVGQPELLDTLARPELASLRQRIVVRAALEPLGVEESADYLLHHLRAAGGRAEAIIDPEALELLARGAGGVPRLLNQAAHQALRLAAEADQHSVEAEAALEALALLGLSALVADESVLPILTETADEGAGSSGGPVETDTGVERSRVA
jgi:type II secretory pathway predicted ATPase ExeA